MSDQFQKSNKRPMQQPLRQFPTIGLPEENTQENAVVNHYGMSGDDHFQISAEEEEELRRARKEKLNPPISPQGKTRLEYLTDIGKMTKDITIGSSTFTLRTLKAREQRQVYLTLVDVSNKIDEAYNLKFYSLSYSLIKIDGIDINLVVKINSLQDKIKILEDLEETTTDQLFSAYQELKSSSDKQFSIKDDKDMKEVSEDLKK